MTSDDLHEPHLLKLTRSEDDHLVYLNSNGRCLAFTHKMWDELFRMMSDFNSTGARCMLNYEEQLPVRTPLHANVPVARKTNLEDLA